MLTDTGHRVSLQLGTGFDAAWWRVAFSSSVCSAGTISWSNAQLVIMELPMRVAKFVLVL